MSKPTGRSKEKELQAMSDMANLMCWANINSDHQNTRNKLN